MYLLFKMPYLHCTCLHQIKLRRFSVTRNMGIFSMKMVKDGSVFFTIFFNLLSVTVDGTVARTHKFSEESFFYTIAFLFVVL